MKSWKLLLLFLFVFYFPAWCQTAQESSEQQFAEIGDFTLENGEVIQNCRIGYRVFGMLDEKHSNAILYPSWFGGNSLSVSQWVGPGKLVDSSRYFVVVVDALGNGVSSSPSNSKEQPGPLFPTFNIRDMVRSQYYLVKNTLGIEHLHGIIGGSMGGMQAFEWLVCYPDFMDRVVPYVGTPQLSSHDLLLFHTMLHVMVSGKRSNMPEEEILKTMRMMTALAMHSPQYRVKQTSHQNFPEFLAMFDKAPLTPMNSDDFMSQIRAMLQHDISQPFEGSMEKAAAAVKAEVFIIVCLQDHAVNPQPAIDFGKMIKAECLILDNDMGHLAIGNEIKRISKAISEFFDK